MIKVSSFNRPLADEAHKPFKIGHLLPAFLFICLLWVMFYIDMNSSFKFYKLGVFPQTFFGLIGIVFSPLVHGSLSHLASNSLPLLVLGTALFYFYPKKAGSVVLYSWLGSGILVWLFARPSFHIGASGLVYALVAFIMLSGILRKQTPLLAISFLVIFLYGSLIWGVFPFENGISHEAHLSGAFVGFTLAFVYRKEGYAPKKYSWDEEFEEEEPFISKVKENDKQEDWRTYYAPSKGVEYDYKPKDKP